MFVCIEKEIVNHAKLYLCVLSVNSIQCWIKFKYFNFIITQDSTLKTNIFFAGFSEYYDYSLKYL